jgi:cytidylate kinase
MSPKNSSERMAEVMARARHQWRARRRAEVEVGTAPQPPPSAFTIALSREAGANGALVARALGERLGWAVYDRELLERVAEAMGLRASLLEGVDERRQSWLRECLEALTAAAGVSEGAFVRHLLETLLSLAANGECVIVGRGAAQILPAATTLRVRLVGPVAGRTEVVRQRLGVSAEEAGRWVAETDAERSRFVKDYFGKDPPDPRLYDLVLNSARFSVPECAELIIETLRRLQARPPAECPGLVTG